MAKRKISETMLQKVSALGVEAKAAQNTAREARRREVDTGDRYDRKLRDLRVKIATGNYTTGDHLLDINIVVNESVQKDERYSAMAELEERLLCTEAGELVAQVDTPAGTPQVRLIGILPESPRLQLHVGGAFGRGRVFGGDSSVRVVIPVVNECGVVSELLTPQWGRSDGGVTLGENIIYEDQLQWILENEPNMNLAVGLWSKAQLLGRPLVAPERVTREIMVRREKCALDLRRKLVGLSTAVQDLSRAQKDPKSWALSQLEPNGAQVTVSFPENISNIKRYRKSLSEEVGNGRRLGMANEPVSPILTESLKLLEETVEWGN